MMKVFCFFIGIICILNAEPFSEIEMYEPVNMYDHHYKGYNNLVLRGDSAFLDSFIRATMEQYHIPGLSSCVVKNGQVIWQQAFGYASFEDSILVADTTIFTLMSISKTVTGVALMQLWQQGLFGLDDNINDYLPFSVVHPFFPDSIITIRMLLTHTSAINDNWGVINSLVSWGGDSPIPLGQFLVDYLVPGGAYYNASQNFNNWSPGVAFDYCNVASALAGYLVEAISDSFPTHCRDSIFEPLSMDETSWFYADLDTDNIAVPYQWNGSYTPYGQYGNPIYPAGFLKTSAPHLTRFLTAFMQYGQLDSVRILDSTTVDLMITVQNPSIQPNWGLFWYRMLLYTRELWGHTGGWYGWRTFMFFCPAETAGVVVLTNGENIDGIYMIANELFNYAGEYAIEEANENIPTFNAFKLYQNFPNPFCLSTALRFTLPYSTKINLRIYNALGQHIRTLIDNKLDAGKHSIIFSAEDLPGGIYFYRIEADRFTQTKRCVLLKNKSR